MVHHDHDRVHDDTFDTMYASRAGRRRAASHCCEAQGVRCERAARAGAGGRSHDRRRASIGRLICVHVYGCTSD